MFWITAKTSRSCNQKPDSEKGKDSPLNANTTNSAELGWFHHWWWEISCIFCMIMSILAIVLTLGMHQHHPLPDWPFSITINTLLAIYTTLFKGAMLLVVAEVLAQLKWFWYRNLKPLYDLEVFDQASRGPIGALNLLWTFRKQLSTATPLLLGALLTSIAILIDPFAQQIVRYYSCSTPSEQGAKAIIPRVNIYFKEWQTPHFMPYTLDSNTRRAVYYGILGVSNSSETNPFRCETGRCDFDDYYSLDWCSQCEDISNRITKSISEHHREIRTRYGLPSGLSLIWDRSHRSQRMLLNARQLESDLDFNPDIHTGLEIEIIAGQPEMLRNSNRMNWSSENPYPGAAHCSLYLCVQRFAAYVHKGVFVEKQKESYPIAWREISVSCGKDNDYGRPNIHVLISCLNSTELKYLATAGYFLDEKARFLRLGCPNRYSAIYDKLNPTCLFAYDPFALSTLHDFTRKFFHGAVFEINRLRLVGPTQLQVLFNDRPLSYDEITLRFQAIAKALTANMRRSNKASYSLPVLGTALETTTCVTVRWAWIALPIALLLWTLSLLLYTLALSNKIRGSTWKSSTMALLFHGLNDTIRSKHTSASTRNMEHVSRRLQVKLQRTSNGWRFAEEGEEENHSVSIFSSPSDNRAESLAHDGSAADTTPSRAEIQPPSNVRMRRWSH